MFVKMIVTLAKRTHFSLQSPPKLAHIYHIKNLRTLPKILLKLGWAPALVPDPALLFYSCTISEITWFSLGTILLQVPLQLIKGKKRKKKKSSIFCSCLLKSCLCWAEIHRMPHKGIWFQCHGFPWRTKFTSTSHIPAAFTPLPPLLLHCDFLYPPFLSYQLFVLLCSCGHFSCHGRTFLCPATAVFSCLFPNPPLKPCHKPSHTTLISAGDSKGMFVWWAFGGWSKVGPDAAVGYTLPRVR